MCLSCADCARCSGIAQGMMFGADHDLWHGSIKQIASQSVFQTDDILADAGVIGLDREILTRIRHLDAILVIESGSCHIECEIIDIGCSEKDTAAPFLACAVTRQYR